jgi:O-antigen/teichoic acid export membrane protein
LALFVPGATSGVLLRMIAATERTAMTEGDKHEIASFLRLQLLIACVIGVVIVACAPQLLALFGEAFEDQAHLAALAVIQAIAMTLQLFVWYILVGWDRRNAQLVLTLVWAISSVGLVYALRDFGASGALIAGTVAYVLFAVGGWATISKSFAITDVASLK